MLVMTLASSAFWVYSMFQLSSSRLPLSKEMNSFSGTAPVELGASAPLVEALPPLSELPPHAASRLAAPTMPAPLRKLRRSSL